MKLNPGDPIFGTFKGGGLFESPFPTEASLFDSRIQALLGQVSKDPKFATVGQALLSRAGAIAWNQAQGLCNYAKMTLVGDLPSDWLPDVAWIKNTKSGAIAEGLFAAVAYPSLQNSLQFAAAIAEVGLDAALQAINAVPIYGWIAKAVLSFGRALIQAWTAQDVPVVERKYQLPWDQYVQDKDVDLVNFFLIPACGTVDWTSVFAPPTEILPWSLAEGVADGQVVGKIFAPFKVTNGKAAVAWNSSLGVIPGSVRTAGLIQTRPTYTPGNQKLLRYFNNGAAIPWAPSLIQTGDFRPALSQAGGQLWQQVQKAGSPDMFKVDTRALDTAWSDWFDAFFSSVWGLAADDEWLGDLAAPYIVVERNPEDILLGLPWRVRPQPAPIIWPGIFDQGPARPTARTNCLFADLKIPQTIRPGESVDPFWWPWHREPDQAGYGPPYKIVDGHLASDGGAVTGKKPSDWRCYPWPSGVEQLSFYRRPFQGLVRPALARLRELQFACLSRTLVCAYVRPESGPAGERYAAFADPALRARIFDLRKQLLVSRDRFLVNMQDAKQIDPEYASALAESGVPTNPVARKALLLSLKMSPGGVPPGEVDPVGPAVPQPLPPLGGVAFGGDDDKPGPGKGGAGGGGGTGAALIAGSLALAAYLKLRR